MDAREDEDLLGMPLAVSLWVLALVMVGAVGMIAGTTGVLFAALGALGVWLYLLPIWVARRRGAPDFAMVVVITLIFGWTLLGWGVALALAFRDPRA